MQPAQVAVSLATLEQGEAQARQRERQWHLRRERAQYEADLARRRFLAVDPENRLVARTLERAWNDKLAALATLELVHLPAPLVWTDHSHSQSLLQEVQYAGHIGMPTGRWRPSGFGMYTRSTGRA